MDKKNLHALISPTKTEGRSDTVTKSIRNPATMLRRAVRAADVLMNPEDGQRRSHDAEAAAAYIAVAAKALREVQIVEKEDRTPLYIMWLRDQLRGKFKGRELEDIARELRDHPKAPGFRKSFKLEKSWPSISVISRQRIAIRKSRLKK